MVQIVEFAADWSQDSLDMGFDHVLEHFQALGGLSDLIAERFQ